MSSQSCDPGNATCNSGGFNGTSSGGFQETLQKSSSDGPLAIALLIVAIIIGGVFGYFYLGNQGSSDFNPVGSGSLADFQVPKERDEYIKYREEVDAKGAAPSSDQLKRLINLLMKRAIGTIPLYHKVHNEYGSTERLYKKGMLTEEVYNQLKALNDFVNEEIKRVMEEAEELTPGFGKQIWPKANEIHMQLAARLKEMEGTSGSPGDDDENDEKDKEAAEEGEWGSDDDGAEEVETMAVSKAKTSAPSKAASPPSSSSSSSKAASDKSGTGAGAEPTSPGVATEADRQRAERELLAEADRDDAKRDKLQQQKKGSPQKKKK